MMEGGNNFLVETSERADLNQYWFSKGTIAAFVDEVEATDGSAALVSTPSIYFSLSEAVRTRSKVLDFDRQWEADAGFVFYDFNEPDAVPSELHNTFDFVLVDPPFITPEVWEKYATTTRLLLRPGGRVLCTTIAENASMMQELLGLQPVRFRPSIPTLVYQYSVYTNYQSDRLDALNPEIDDEDWMAAAQQQRVQHADDVRDILRESCKANVTSETVCTDADASKKAALSGYGSDVPVPADSEVAPIPPAVLLLSELRSRLNVMKRCAEAINTPVQTAIRRRQAGGEAAAAASAKANSALDAAELAAKDLSEWVCSHRGEAAAALGEGEEAFTRSLEQDRFRTQAVLCAVTKARGDGLKTMADFNDFSLAGKQHSAAVFRLGNHVMDRIKVLKREAAAGST